MKILCTEVHHHNAWPHPLGRLWRMSYLCYSLALRCSPSVVIMKLADITTKGTIGNNAFLADLGTSRSMIEEVLMHICLLGWLMYAL